MLLAENLSDDILADMWRRTKWKKAEETLAAQQRFLTKAVKKHDHGMTRKLQDEIVSAIDNKCLAVRHVAKTGSVPGVDGVKWENDADMMKAAFMLSPKNYHASPMRRIKIESRSNGKIRYADIPTYYDRAMSVLYGYSLIPVTEAVAEKKSFAFRPGRSAHDAHAYILEALKGQGKPEWVVCVDIECFYSSLQHTWLMQNVPMDKTVLSEFLSSGMIFAGELFPDDGYGISEGGNLSPYLANFTLDGLQKHIYMGLHGKYDDIDYDNGNMVRFADDIVVFVRSHETATKVVELIHGFMAQRGLHLSFAKSRIFTIYEGFSYLSRTYVKKNGVVYSYPSDAAVERFKSELHEYIISFQKSQRELIMGLNRRLEGWANYHRYSDANDAFKSVDVAVQASLLEAVQAKHPKMPQKKLISKYWYTEADGRHVFALAEDKGVRVIRLSDVLILNHRKINIKANPYIDSDYFESRTHEREIMNMTGRYKAVWKRQDGKCIYCGRKILKDQGKVLTTLNLSVKPSLSNSAYVHEICSRGVFEKIYTTQDTDMMTPFDVLSTLTLLEAQPDNSKVYDRINNPEWRYFKLKRYFAKSRRSTISMTFEELEKLIGRKLGKNLRNNRTAWYPRKQSAGIAYAWTSEGYHIKKLDLEKCKVSFQVEDSGISRLNIPEELTRNKIPDNARVELERFMKYIVQRYNLSKSNVL